MPEALPTSPDEMPNSFHNDENWLRNTLVTLHWKFSFVELVYTEDQAASDASGESVGEWEVTAEDRGQRYHVKHEEITNCLWFLDVRSNADNRQFYEQHEAAKTAALAKLTPTEKRLLRLIA